MELNHKGLRYAGLLFVSGPAYVGVMPSLAMAHAAQATAPDNVDDDIVVTARRNQFDADPDRRLQASDIDLYGRDTIGELLGEIAAESGDSNDDAVFLINGKRVAGLSGIENLPAETISSVEVYPTGSPGIAGTSAAQRVYNIILKPAADIATLRGEWKIATDGGWSSRQATLDYTHIRDSRRIAVTFKKAADDVLLESERDLSLGYIFFDDTDFRSLSPSRERWNLSLSAADELAPWLQASIGAKFQESTVAALLGRVSTDSDIALQQETRSRSIENEITLNAQKGDWIASAFGSYRTDIRKTLTDKATPDGTIDVRDIRSRSSSLNALLTASGPLLRLPAGPARLLLSSGIFREDSARKIRNREISGNPPEAQLSRTLGAGLEIPLTSRTNGPLKQLGDLVVTTELTKLWVTDMKASTNWNISLNWRLSPWLRFSGLLSENSAPPPLALQNDPILETPGFLYYDPLNLQTRAVTRITGGLENLPRRSTDTKRIGIYARALDGRLRLSSEYVETDVKNAIIDLPLASAAVLAAYPDRFIRNSIGELTAVDARPIALSRRTVSQLKFGANLNIRFAAVGRSNDAAPSESGGAEDSGSPNEASGGSSRLQVSGLYTRLLNSSLVLNSGDRPINLLSPEAIGLGRLAQSRHRFNLNVGYSERGFGVRLTMQHQSKARLNTNGNELDALNFAPLTTFDLRSWAQGNKIFSNSKLMKSMRFTVAVQNVAGTRERVTDNSGLTPIAYQPIFRDPIGRTVAIEARKTF